MARQFLEIVLGIKLPPQSPSWLVNPRTGRLFRLDGYNQEQAIAFEYHGAQHYEHRDIFHRGGRSLEVQQARDALVRALCTENGVTLIEIPSLDGALSIDSVIAHCLPIVEQVKGKISPDRISEFRAQPLNTGMLQRMQELAASKGGACDATYYINATTNYPFRCKHGHVWQATWHSIQKGTWCASCAQRVKPSLALLQAKATEYGGLCLAKEGEYKSNKVPVLWRCAVGHEWPARWNNIANGGWCPHCARARKKI